MCFDVLGNVACLVPSHLRDVRRFFGYFVAFVRVIVKYSATYRCP
jgi:hypothetical protein